MLFNSFAFLVFFPLVTLLYFLLPHRFRWFLLLTASCVFYMYFIPIYILILAFTIVIDYFAGLLIEGASGSRRKLFLGWSIAANVGVLAIFKYYGFLNDNLAALAAFLHWNYSLKTLAIILPVGLSFHTFQAMSYTFEVYYGRHKAERHFGIYALYVMFFPQLVAGPIERPQRLLPQFRLRHRFDSHRAAQGLALMTWGFFKKMVIADRLALYVDAAYRVPAASSGLDLLLATYCFAIQIYCDFSGYSDIALGSAQILGFELMTNFRMPYVAQSIKEFWQRWHISLSTWFRDYLYIPLGGNRVSAASRYRNLLITFLVSGLWHGANWVFVIWGALHGLYVVGGAATAGIRARSARRVGFDRLPAWLQAVGRASITFHLVLIAWVFFRAANVSEAWSVFTGIGRSAIQGFVPRAITLAPGRDLVFMLVVVLAAGLYEARREALLARWPLLANAAWFSVLIWAILIFGVYDNRQFIYFQF